MPFLFLSPSTQYFNPYITTGDERYWMNALADEMMPYLHASGITVTRNDPDGSAAQSIRDSNASRQDFHLALHSNAAPQALSGRLRGVDIYYYPTSEAGLRMANILVDDIRPVYPLPDRVQARSSTVIGELRRTRAPAVLAELGYHDNTEDANWLTGNLDEIARVLALGVTEYFGVPFLTPGDEFDAEAAGGKRVYGAALVPADGRGGSGTDSERNGGHGARGFQRLVHCPSGRSVRLRLHRRCPAWRHAAERIKDGPWMRLHPWAVCRYSLYARKTASRSAICPMGRSGSGAPSNEPMCFSNQTTSRQLPFL